MIISHKYRFVFVRTRKVASSSLEICLSQLLEQGDFVTPQTERDARPEAAHAPLNPRFFHGFDRFGLPILFGGHAGLVHAYRTFGRRLEGYRIITAERNPWDRAISLFYWSHRKTEMRARPLDEQIAAFRAWLLRNGDPAGVTGRWRRLVAGHRLVSQRHLYSLNGVPCADVILRYERLSEDLERLSSELGLERPLDLSGIRAKTGYRAKASRELARFHDEDTRALVARACAWEIEALGYRFDSDTVADFTPDPRRAAAKAAAMARYGRGAPGAGDPDERLSA